MQPKLTSIKQPSNFGYPVIEGRNLLQDGDLEGALLAFTYAIEGNDNLSAAYAGRGDTLISLRRFTEALEDYSKSLEIEITPEVLASRCNTYRLTAAFELALEDCNNALAIDPQNVTAHIAAAMLFLEKDQLNLAQKEADVAIRIDPSSIEAVLAASQIAIAEGDSEAAIVALSRCIEIDQSNPECYWHRGFLYTALGQIKLAIEDMQAVLDLGDPNIHGRLMLEAGTVLRQFGEHPDD